MREKVVAGVVVGGPVCRRNAALMEEGGAVLPQEKRESFYRAVCERDGG